MITTPYVAQKMTQLNRTSAVYDLPEDMNPITYAEKLEELYTRLDSIPLGRGGASAFEDAVGDVVRLCFFPTLGNVRPQVRNADRTVVRDWIASNRAQSVFWQTMQQRYDAINVIWECKNKKRLQARDWAQTESYISKKLGRLVIIAFRGDVRPSYYPHIRKIADDKDGMVILLGIEDLKTFILQNENEQIKENHIRDRYDEIADKIS
jgi:hypothetical protein